MREKIIELACQYCGIHFFVDTAHVYQKYCSFRCRNDNFKKNNPEKVREYKRRERIKNATRYRNVNGQYKNKIRFGGNRRRVMERDTFSCLDCKRKYPDVSLIVHHIDKDKSNNVFENLMTLCRSCHINRHRDDLVSSNPY